MTKQSKTITPIKTQFQPRSGQNNRAGTTSRGHVVSRGHRVPNLVKK